MKQYSGIYPHLAVFNQSDGECGIGAVVSWAGKLWYLTYMPHAQNGSDDKFYELDTDLRVAIRPESIGGTPAGRMIHRESDQLLIGAYLVDGQGQVRVIPPSVMPGRITAMCRHLTGPENLVYYLMMEGPIFEVNVHTLDVRLLFEKPVPGWHGKGMYKSQGRIVIANNGDWKVEATDTSRYQVEDLPDHPDRIGCLAEWDGGTWAIIERKQHTEVMGPGGLLGNESDDDPIWTTGWDKRSCLLKVLDGGVWHRFRMPKASYTYDGRHGWHTEWPRIREVADGFLMMDLHGMFYRFPETFSAAATGGIRPLSSHHQMVVDYCEWQGRTAIACNHASHMDNPFVGRCQSNLWFVEKNTWTDYGPRSGWGGPWIEDDVAADECSDPYFFAGFDRRGLHLAHQSGSTVEFALEMDPDGAGNWQAYETLAVPPKAALSHIFLPGCTAEWIRIRPLQDVKGVTAYFHYAGDPANQISLGPGQADIFTSIPGADDDAPFIGGIVRPMGAKPPQDETRLQFIAKRQLPSGEIEEQQYIVDEDMTIRKDDKPDAYRQFKEELAGDVSELDFGIDAASIWVEKDGRRFRLPKGDPAFDAAFSVGLPRGKREIVTERSVWNAHGTFYEVPRENSGGVRHMRPVCTHNRKIMDYCTWRGLLTIAGVSTDAAEDDHCVRSEDGNVALWFGAVDDLWRLGKPVGTGGPLKDTPVEAGEASDPYLMTNYDEKRLTLSHDAGETVRFTVEADPTGYDTWMIYQAVDVPSGETIEHEFYHGFNAHWLRVTAARACSATAQLEYT